MRTLQKAFAERTFDEYLFFCKINDGDTLICQGIGRIFFRPKAEFAHIEVVGANNDNVKVLVGTLQSQSPSFAFDAITATGYKVSGVCRLIQCDRFHTKTNMRTWRFSPEEIVLENVQNLPDKPWVAEMPTHVDALVYDLPGPIFYEQSETKTTGFAESSDGRRDWTRFKIENVEVKLLEGKGNGSTIVLKCLPGTAVDAAQKAFDAVLKAVSVRCGGAILPVATLISRQGYERLTLHVSNEGQRRHAFSLAPISYSHNKGEDLSFLNCATSYFFKEPESLVYFHLNETWNSELLSWRNRQTMVGTAVEAICKLALDKFKPKEAWKEENEKAKSMHSKIKSKIVAEIEKMSWEPGEEKALEIVKKGVQEVRLHFASDSLRHAAQILGIEISDGEISSWTRMRNAAAHGRLDKELSRQEQELDLIGATTILNKLTLRVIGWEGNFFDYSNKVNIRPLMVEDK